MVVGGTENASAFVSSSSLDHSHGELQLLTASCLMLFSLSLHYFLRSRVAVPDGNRMTTTCLLFSAAYDREEDRSQLAWCWRQYTN